MQEQTGVTPKELEDCVDLPSVFNDVWHWFLMLNSSRTSSMSVNPIAFSEMQAFFDLMQINPLPWEIEILKIFDNVAMKHYSKELDKKSKK